MENKSRLNNFILWCKGWYVSTKNEDIIVQAQKILQLDEYLACNNPISIVLNYMDELVEKGTIPPIRLLSWNSDIVNYMRIYNFSYEESVLFQVRNYFKFNVSGDDIVLIPPKYSRKLYKLGFIAPTDFGNSYKMANYKVNKFFNKKSYGKN